VSRCITPVPPPANPGPLVTKPFLGESVALREKKPYGPFAALPGTSIIVELKPAAGATGDADLYVRLAQDPTEEADKFDCRPFRTGSTESCELSARDSPRNEAHVMVLGRTAARYDLTVSYHAAR
jgi:hypothetical protein